MFLRGTRSAYSAKPEACSFDNRQHFSRAEESFAVGPGPVPRLTEDVSLPVVFPTFSGENGTYRSERGLVHVPQIDRRRNEVVRTICCTQSAISSISSSTHGLSLHTTTKGPSRYAPWSVYAAAIASRKNRGPSRCRCMECHPASRPRRRSPGVRHQSSYSPHPLVFHTKRGRRSIHGAHSAQSSVDGYVLI